MSKKKGIVFEVVDVLKNRTILFKHTLSDHVFIKHTDVSLFLETVKSALLDPDKVIRDDYGTLHFYVTFTERQKEYLETTENYLVVVSNNKGIYRIISTFYKTLSIKKGVIVYAKK